MSDQQTPGTIKASDRYEQYRRVSPRLASGLGRIEAFVYPHAMVTAIERGVISARAGDVCLRVNGVKVAVLSPATFAAVFAFTEEGDGH